MTYPERLKKASIVGIGSYREYIAAPYAMLRTDMMELKDQYLANTLERFFPYLVVNLFGRAALLIQEDMIPAYD